ncbi:MAG: phosphotransferase [Candidatus Poribacteria bacterium]|nr:phosphotransferase [Candidatus Poribacteria bacterium]
MSKEAVRRATQKLLTEAWGGKVSLKVGDDEGLSGRQYVHRFEVKTAPKGSPASIVVKQAPERGDQKYDPTSDNFVTTRFFNEWACLRFMSEVCSEPLPVPRFYGGNVEAGFVVMEDLGTGQRLDHALLGDDPAFATKTLVGLFESTGRMHAATVGKRERFEAILNELSERRHPTQHGGKSRYRRQMREGFAAIGVSPKRGFYAEMERIEARKTEEPFHALIHGDPCPDNCHWVGDRVVLLDFEHGRFDNAFSDGCYPVIHFPTCWCVSRLPEEVSRQAVAAYRAELVKGSPNAADDATFERAMTDASLRWAYTTFLGWSMPGILEKDHQWGLVTVRQRVLFRLGLVVEMLERNGLYPAVAETSRRAVAALSERWAEVEAMPLYPAFR